jgi:hypothetical protein
MTDVTVAMVTSASRLFEPDEAIRGKVFVFTAGKPWKRKSWVCCEPKWQEE